jgi:release factor glutamine methyltransferase
MRRPENPDLRAALKALTTELQDAGIESPRAEAERLIALVTGIDRPRLAIEGNSALQPAAAGRLAELIRRRVGGEPLQHLEGSTEFRGLTLVCDGRALIPRPETEQLVDLIQRWIRTRTKATGSVRTVRRPGRALDIGTGSGAIALALASEGLASRVVGLDVSAAAIEQAEENRRAAALDERVEFRRVGADPFETLAAGERFSFIVSNPPYITDEEMAALPGTVSDFEPAEALRGGADGLDVLRIIVTRAHEHLEESGRLFLEVGAGQAATVADLLAAEGHWTDIRSHEDLAGRSRFVTAGKA